MRHRSGGNDLVATGFFGLGIAMALAGVGLVVVARDGAPIVLVLVGGILSFACWTVRAGSGIELDEEAGAFLLYFLGGEPERISFETAIVRIPDPRIAFTVAGGPPVEIRSGNGVVRRSPFLYQGQFVHAPRLRRFEAECVRVGVPVVRS